MTFGQPPDTAVMSRDSDRSISWVMVSSAALPVGSSSMVQRLGPSALNSGFHSFCHRMLMRTRRIDLEGLALVGGSPVRSTAAGGDEAPEV